MNISVPDPDSIQAEIVLPEQGRRSRMFIFPTGYSEMTNRKYRGMTKTTRETDLTPYQDSEEGSKPFSIQADQPFKKADT